MFHFYNALYHSAGMMRNATAFQLPGRSFCPSSQNRNVKDTFKKCLSLR